MTVASDFNGTRGVSREATESAGADTLIKVGDVLDLLAYDDSNSSLRVIRDGSVRFHVVMSMENDMLVGKFPEPHDHRKLAIRISVSDPNRHEFGETAANIGAMGDNGGIS